MNLSIAGGFIIGARLKTLISSISPVLVGTVMACDTNRLCFSIFMPTLLFALFVQIGMNFANDYLDFLKKADTAERVGPCRAVQSGLVSVCAMRMATFGTLIIAGVVGLYLMHVGGWQIGALALLAILLAYFYSGGPYPIGYLGLGDLCVLLFLGPTATVGTAYLQTQTLSLNVAIAGLALGLFSTVMIAMNNLRDLEQDRIASKKTLPVRFGTLFGKWEITCCLILPHIIPLYLFYRTNAHPLSLLSICGLFPSISLIRALFEDKKLPLLFHKTICIFTLYTMLFTLGWVFS